MNDREGEAIGGVGAGVKGAEGARLDLRYNNISHIYKNRDWRVSTKEESIIEIRETSIKVKIKYERKSLSERLYCAPGMEGNKENALELIKALRAGANKEKRKARGKIVRFSKFSQRSCRDKLSELERSELPLMVDLTFPDEIPSLEDTKRYFHNFEMRIKRAYPGVGVFWKEEVIERKSGQNKGKIAAHFHTLVYGVKDKKREFTRWVKRAWYEIVGSNDPRHKKHGAWVKEAYEKGRGRGFRSYLRKYMGKGFEYENLEGIGRLWGYFGNVPFGEVRVIEEDTKIVFGVLRILRKKERAYRRMLVNEGIMRISREPPKGKRFFDTGQSERMTELIDLVRDKYVPF